MLLIMRSIIFPVDEPNMYTDSDHDVTTVSPTVASMRQQNMIIDHVSDLINISKCNLGRLASLSHMVCYIMMSSIDRTMIPQPKMGLMQHV